MKCIRRIKFALFAAAVLFVMTTALLSACADAPQNELPLGGAPESRIDAPRLYEEDSEHYLLDPASPSEPEKRIISFLAAGDNIVHSNVYEDARERATDTSLEYNFLPMYDGIADLIQAADIAFINQETVMAGASYGYSGYPNFNSPQDMGETLIELGFDIVNIANNHMLDKRESGLLDTIAYWEEKEDILLLGAYKNAEDYDNIRVYDYDGITIAFLSYTYGTNGMSLPAGSEHIIPLIVEADISRQIALAKEVGDLVFASIHWGDENRFQPSAHQEKIAQLMVDGGVDVIIGHHPHVVQKMEWAENADGHRTLVIYSLGNLISTMLDSFNMVGGLVTFDIVQEGMADPYIDNPLFIPVMCHYSTRRRGLQVYRLEEYTAELASQHGVSDRASLTLDKLRGYVTEHIDAQFLPDSFLS